MGWYYLVAYYPLISLFPITTLPPGTFQSRVVLTCFGHEETVACKRMNVIDRRAVAGVPLLGKKLTVTIVSEIAPAAIAIRRRTHPANGVVGERRRFVKGIGLRDEPTERVIGEGVLYLALVAFSDEYCRIVVRMRGVYCNENLANGPRRMTPHLAR